MVSDILIAEDGSPRVLGGDLVVGESDTQHIEHHVILHKGELKDAAYMGIGITAKLKGPLTPELRRKAARDLRVTLESDGASRVSTSWNNNLEATASYA